MSWLELAKLGEHTVYAIDPSMVTLESSKMTFHAREWICADTKASVGEVVAVHIPLGGLSGEHKHALVQRQDGSIEIWRRTD